MGAKLTHDVFIDRLKNMQPKIFTLILEFIDKYEKMNSRIRVRTKYGICYVTPNKLLHGRRPSVQSSIDKKDFIINKLKEIHKESLEYEFNRYLSDSQKITVICKTHGKSIKTISSLLQGSGCAKCSNERLAKELSWNHSDFETELKLRHSDYIKNIEILDRYHNAKKKIRIKNKFGVCLLSPEKILQGGTGTILSAENKTEYYISQVKEFHKDFYDYSKVIYINEIMDVEIICPIHGSFWQKARIHKDGHGCPLCNSFGVYIESIVEKNKDSLLKQSCQVYIIACFDKNTEESFYKIGLTSNGIKNRFATKNDLPYDYYIVDIISTNKYSAFKIESKLHEINEEKKYIPKNKFAGWTECFYEVNEATQKLIEKLKSEAV